MYIHYEAAEVLYEYVFLIFSLKWFMKSLITTNLDLGVSRIPICIYYNIIVIVVDKWRLNKLHYYVQIITFLIMNIAENQEWFIHNFEW